MYILVDDMKTVLFGRLPSSVVKRHKIRVQINNDYLLSFKF